MCKESVCIEPTKAGKKHTVIQARLNQLDFVVWELECLCSEIKGDPIPTSENRPPGEPQMSLSKILNSTPEILDGFRDRLEKVRNIMEYSLFGEISN